MYSVLEIEKALRQLPPQERWEIACWLLEDLQKGSLNPIFEKSSSVRSDSQPPALPDYTSRRRRIFGAKVLPNMVLTARADEPR